MDHFLYDRRLVLKENSTDDSVLYFSSINRLDNDFFIETGINIA